MLTSVVDVVVNQYALAIYHITDNLNSRSYDISHIA